jgi:hypothetical protein
MFEKWGKMMSTDPDEGGEAAADEPMMQNLDTLYLVYECSDCNVLETDKLEAIKALEDAIFAVEGFEVRRGVKNERAVEEGGAAAARALVPFRYNRRWCCVGSQVITLTTPLPPPNPTPTHPGLLPARS